MSLMAPQPVRKADPNAKYRLTNNTESLIRLPVRAPIGETKGEKRVRKDNYIQVGTKHERGLVGAPQPDVEVEGSVWAFMQAKPAIQEMIQKGQLSVVKVG